MAIIIITIISTVVGLVLNSIYSNKYNVSAIHWGAFAAQCVFMALALLSLPNPDISGWFILWVVCSVIAYTIALVVCRVQAIGAGAGQTDIVIAMLAQAVLPLGVALIIVILIALVLLAMGNNKKK